MTNEILSILATVASGLLIFLLRNVIMERNKNKNMRKKRTIWIKVLRSNEIINKCISDFEKLEDQNLYPMPPFFGGVFTSIIIIFVLFIISNLVLGNQFISITYAYLINLPLCIISPVLLSNYINSKGEKRNLLSQSNSITKWFMFTKGLMYSAIFEMIFIIITYLNSKQIQMPYQYNIENTFGPSFIVLFSVLLASLSLNTDLHRNFLNYIKNEMNARYSKDFPYIHIKTKTGEIEGKVQDIFHEDLIILDNSGMKEIAAWNEITILKSTMR